MSSIIQPNYGARAYSTPTKAHETTQSGTRGRSFLDLAARASRGTTDVLEISNAPEVTNGTSTSNVDAYREYLSWKYGNVIVQDVGKDQRRMDSIGASTAGHNNVVIAPNILEQMANDPQKAAYYESKIQAGLNNFPKVQAQASAAGFEVQSYGVGVEADGTVYTYLCADLKPEVRAKIEAKIKAEQEEKQNRRQKYQKLSEAAAERRAMWERVAQAEMLKKSFSNSSDISDLLKTRLIFAPTVTPEVSLPTGANMFFLNMV